MGQVSTSSKSRSRLGSIVALGALTLGTFVLLGRGAPERGEDEDRSIVDTWLAEVEQGLGSEACAFPAKSDHLRFAAHLKDSAPLWEAQARLGASEALRRAHVIQGWLACPNEAPKGERQALKETQSKLFARVEQSLRTYVALLRRAEAEKQPAEAQAAVVALKELLDAHAGPLQQRLSELEQRYKNES